MEDFLTSPNWMEHPVLLQDDAGSIWQLHKRRIDLRVVRRLLKDPRATVILGECGGTHPRLLAHSERSGFWSKVKNNYQGPGGDWSTGRFLAHEFRTHDDRRMLFIEEHC
ncbi:hypothetical protein ACWEO2_30285 [Nocardia sp. NPDC004278]